MKTDTQMFPIIGLLPVCARLAAAQSDRTQRLPVLGVAISTVERTWAFARPWLFRELNGVTNIPPNST